MKSITIQSLKILSRYRLAIDCLLIEIDDRFYRLVTSCIIYFFRIPRMKFKHCRHLCDPLNTLGMSVLFHIINSKQKDEQS